MVKRKRKLNLRKKEVQQSKNSLRNKLGVKRRKKRKSWKMQT